MRILLIGCGRIGSLRARLLADLGHTPYLTDVEDFRSEWLYDELGAAGRRCAWVQFDCRHKVGSKPYDAALICTPTDTHIPLALACLRAGIQGVFIENPVSPDLNGVGALQRASNRHVLMIACSLRFACNLPRYPWAMLEIINSEPVRSHRAGAVAAGWRQRAPLDVVYGEIDLAYSVNGPIRSTNCVHDVDKFSISIEHDSLAYTEIAFEWSEYATIRHHAIVSAYDDGAGLRLPHQPVIHKVALADWVYEKELDHFLECVQSGREPCNTMTDAAHVLSWTLEALPKCCPQSDCRTFGHE